MSQVVSSETCMPVQRLMKIIKSDNGLMVQVRWKGLPESKEKIDAL